MVIGIEFNRVKTPSGKTFYRVAPYLNNVSKMKVGVAALLIFTIGFFGVMSAFSKDTSKDNSHIRPYSSYLGVR
jgi:hypothetical protein